MSKEEFEEVNLFDEDNRPIAPIKADVVADLEAEVTTEKPTFNVPEKFKDKSLEDVITSYTNLESQYGRMTNENGELRKLTDEILKQGMDTGSAQKVQPVGFDDLVDDADSAIDKVLARNPRLQAMEAKIAADTATNAHASMKALHADATEVVASADFQKWVTANPSRQQHFADASNRMDVDVAGDMISLYKATQAFDNEAATTQRDNKAKEGLKAAATEQGRVTVGESKKVFKRTELIRLKQYHPQQYTAMEPEIMLAYKEGRVK